MFCIQCDSREQKNKEILDYFNSVGQKYVVSKLYAGDYCNLHSPTVLIDTKKDIEEVIGNLTKDHQRFKAEILRATEEMGCKLVILVRTPLKSLEEVKTYQVRRFGKWYKVPELRGKPMSNMSMQTLYKIMKTIEEKYNVEWRFCSRQDAGKIIINILKGE